MRTGAPADGRETGARLVCLDSLANPLRIEYGTGQQQLPERQQKVDLILHALKRVATATNGVVVLTNQTTLKEDSITSQGAWTHALGNVAGHEAHVRLKIQETDSRTGLREIELVKALDIKPASCEVYLGAEGFSDEPTKNKRREKG